MQHYIVTISDTQQHRHWVTPPAADYDDGSTEARKHNRVNQSRNKVSPCLTVSSVISITTMSPSQRSVSVGNIADYSVTEPLCETNLTHVSCDHLDKKLPRVPPPPPPRVSSLQRAPSQALMHYTTVPQSLVTRSLATRHQPTRSSLRHSRMLVMIREGRGESVVSSHNLSFILLQDQCEILLTMCES